MSMKGSAPSHRVRPAAFGWLALAGSLALLAGACSPAAESAGKSGSDGTVSLKVTTLNLCNEISIKWAMEKGVFAKNNLKIELIKAGGGAAGLAAVQGGSADLTFTNPFSTMLAMNGGLKLKWVATAYGTPKPGDRPSNAILVKEDSPIRSGKDLVGKTVAVNEVGGINQIITQQYVTDAGGDPKQLKFVALPFAELASAVSSGKTDAAQTPAQYANSPGLRSIDDPYVKVGKGKSLIFAGYVGTADFVDKNATAMKNFLASLKEADTAIADPSNKSEKYRLESAICGQDAAKLAKDPENPYFAEVPMDAMKQMAQILVDQGQVKKAPDVAELVPAYSRG